jgi:hypothetical protein
MNRYPDHETYRNLYKRFYNGRSTQDLLELAYPVRDAAVLDLCGGDGRIALKALQYGAKSAVLVDEERDMTEGSNPNIKVINSSVEDFLGIWQWGDRDIYFDRVFCQQAVNYWLDAGCASIISKLLTREGIFVFNTFHNKPSEKPTTKEYEIDGKKFVEVSWLVGDIVHHVQIAEGIGSHTTEFMWLSPEYLMDMLSQYFDVEVKKDGNSSLYRCVKKPAD